MLVFVRTAGVLAVLWTACLCFSNEARNVAHDTKTKDERKNIPAAARTALVKLAVFPTELQPFLTTRAVFCRRPAVRCCRTLSIASWASSEHFIFFYLLRLYLLAFLFSVCFPLSRPCRNHQTFFTEAEYEGTSWNAVLACHTCNSCLSTAPSLWQKKSSPGKGRHARPKYLRQQLPPNAGSRGKMRSMLFLMSIADIQAHAFSTM